MKKIVKFILCVFVVILALTMFFACEEEEYNDEVFLDGEQSLSQDKPSTPTHTLHTYCDWVVTKDPTCTQTGIRERTCSVCQEKETGAIDTIGHTEIIDQSVAPTCTEAGLTEGKHCSVCGQIITAQESLEPLGHTEIIDQSVAPTCTEAGLTEGKHCSVCGQIITAQERLASLGHTEIIDQSVAPTCTETGLTEGKHCSICGTILIAQNVIEKTSHQFNNYVSNNDATCFSNGTKTSVCDYCNVTSTIMDENSIVDHLFQQGRCIYCDIESDCIGIYKLKEITETLLYSGETNVISLGDTYNNEMLVRDYCSLEIKGNGDVAFTKGNLTYSGIWTADSIDISCKFIVDNEELCFIISNNNGELTLTDESEDGTIVYSFEKNCTEHDFSEWIVIESSVCNAMEYRTRFCFHCGYCEFENGMDASMVHPHELALITKASTCTEKGIAYRFQCKKCGTIVAEEETEALGHDFLGVRYTFDNSYHYRECRRCKQTIKQTHQCNTWTTVNESTCAVRGKQTGVCLYCGKNMERTLSLKEHQWDAGTQTIAATCIEEGNRQFVCTICSEVKNESIPMTEHTYDSGTITSEPSCTQTGVKTYECTYCHYLDDRSVSALGHDWDQEDGDITTEPDCYHEGIFTYHCTRCDATNTRYIVKKHSFDSGTVVQAATCTTTGTMRFTCTICSITADKSIPITHAISYIGRQEPTCTEDGKKAHYHCNSCGKDYSSRTIRRSKLEFEQRTYETSYVEYYNYTIATSEELLIPALGHDFSDSLTYNSEYHWYACNHGCGTKKDESAHTLSDAYEHFVEKSGSVYIHKVKCYHNVCSVCGYYQSYTTDAVDTWTISHAEHNSYEVLLPVAPTCEGIGLTAGCKCGVCGEILVEQETIPALGHIFENEICTRCGVGAITYELAADGASYSLKKVNDKSIDSLNIPSTFKDLPVISIQSNAVKDCKELIDVRIPDSVMSIGDSAFSGCISLQRITIPFVGAQAGKTSSDKYQYPLGYIFGTSSYEGGTSTMQFYYGSSKSTMTNTTYYIPSSLRSVTVTGGNILCGAFHNCSKLTSITLSDDVTNIKSGAFRGCSRLTSITVDSNNEAYLSTGNCLIEIETKTLIAGCKNSVIPDDGSVTSIGEYAFYGCSSLTSITIPDSVASIGGNAFYNCTELTSITIPDSVMSIGSSAFDDCTGLRSVYYTGDIASWCGITFGYYSNPLYYAHNLYINNELQTEIVIPDTVTEIKDYVFYGWNGTSITILDSVTSIGNSAFYGCTGLTSITISDSVTSIGSYVFSSCYRLQYNKYDNGYYLGNMNNPYLWLIKAKDTSITSCTIHEATKFIHSYAFSSCSSLTSITIPDSVTSIGGYAFYACGSLTSITIPDRVTSIGSYAFRDCEGLMSVTIGKSVTSIKSESLTGSEAFYGCYRLVEVYNKSCLNITKGSSLNGRVGYYAKNVYTEEGGSKLSTDGNGYIIYTNGEEKSLIGYTGSETVLTLPQIITEINRYAFYGWNGTSITISDSVTSIMDSAFPYCSSLTSVTIPDSVTSIGDSAFSSCNFLQYNEYDNGCYLGNVNNPYLWLIKAKNTSITSCTIHEDTKFVCNSAFKDCSRLTSVYITNIVSWCGITFSGVFSNPLLYAHNLYINNELKTEIVIPDTVTAIKANAFRGWNGTRITIPDSVTSIGDNAFLGCLIETAIVPAIACFYIKNSALKTVVITSGECIKSGYFIECSSLTSITIPDSVTSIGDSAFSSCNSLQYNEYDNGYYIGNENNPYLCFIKAKTSITSCAIHEDTKFIYSEAFYGRGLTSITIPDSVTSIGRNAFKDCYSLRSVTIGKGVTSIGSYAFSSCYGLTSITIPDSVTSIGEYAFSFCKSLTSITIPDSLTSIAHEVFCSCSSLKSITIPDSVTSIGSYAFSGCYGLTSITIPESVTSIGEYVFENCSSLQYHEYDNGYYLGNDNNPYIILIKAKNIDISSCTIHEDTKFIYSKAFSSCSSLTSITIPDSVTSIGYYVFENCSSLQYHEYDNGYYLGNMNNPYLWLIKAKDTSITSCTIHEDTKFIYSRAFSSCSSLTSITIPDSVTSIGKDAFYHCGSLTSVTIPDSVTSVGSSAFAGCALTSITIGNNVTSIGMDAFSSGEGLRDIYYTGDIATWCGITFNVDDYGNCSSNPLYYAQKLYIDNELQEEIVIPDTVTEIKAYAFFGYGLTSITIPDSVTSIGEEAFAWCKGLKNISFTGTQAQWNMISKGGGWNNNAGALTIHCMDGDIAK